MDRLKISQRMCLSTFAFIALAVIIAWFFTQSVQSNVDIAVLEKQGDTYQRPLTNILKKLGDLEILAAQPSSSERNTALAAKAEEISADFKALKTTDEKLGEALQFTPEGLASRQREHFNVKEVTAKWDALKGTLAAADSKTITDQTQSVIADIRGMITHMGDTSTLILDPELNSYYLMDVTLCALPQTIDRIGALGNAVYGMISKGSLTEDDKIEMDRLASMLKESDMDRITGDFSTSYNEDVKLRGGSPTLKKNTEPKLKAYTESNQALIAALQNMAKTGVPMKPQEWLATVQTNLNNAMDLWTASIGELDVLFDMRAADYSGHLKMVLLSMAIGQIVSIIFFYIVIASITKPLRDIQKTMEALAQGHNDVEVPHQNKRDDFGRMAKSLQVFKENSLRVIQLAEEQKNQQAMAEKQKRQAMNELASKFEANVKGVVDMVASAATEMDATSKSVAKITETNQSKLGILTTQIGSATHNVQLVASASSQLSSAISEINKQVVRANTITAGAVEEAKKTDGTAQGLTEATQKIGEVAEMINSIAGQINLLALNATIEAARAGDAGKGFAVVASEVKSLATQTTKATEQIAGYIASIQNVTTDTVSAIKSIGGKIREISEISTTIAAAVEEQSVSTQDIANNVQQAAHGTEEVSRNASDVATSSKETGESANQMMAATSELSRQAETLRREVDKFLVGIRA